jgi:hypothetical protein
MNRQDARNANKKIKAVVARMKRSEIRGILDSATLHPGYELPVRVDERKIVITLFIALF